MKLQKRIILSKENKLIFLHIPKTGGTTLSNILLNYFAEEDVCQARHWDTTPNWKVQKHRKPLSKLEKDLSPYSFFTGHFLFEITRFFPKKPTVITILRNPIERVVSVYNYIKTLDDHPLRSQVDKMSLEEFADWDVPGRPFENKNRYVYDIGVKLNISQPSDIPNAQPDIQNIYDSAMSRIDSFDFVGITERFNESLILLSYLLGVEPILTYINQKVTPKQKNAEPPTSRALRIIEKNNAEDLAIYEHSKRKFESQWKDFVETIFLRH